MRKKKVLSFLLTLVMVFSLFPGMAVTAYAETESFATSVMVFGRWGSPLNDAKLYFSVDGTVHNVEYEGGRLPEKGYINYDPDTGILTLNNFVFEAAESEHAIALGPGPVTINVVGENVLTCTYANGIDGGSDGTNTQLTITGDGDDASLTINSRNSGIFRNAGTVAIENVNLTINARDNGITANQITITNSKINITTADYYSIEAVDSHRDGGTISISGSSDVTLTSTNAYALNYPEEAKFTHKGLNVIASETVDGSLETYVWSKNNQYKHVRVGSGIAPAPGDQPGDEDDDVIAVKDVMLPDTLSIAAGKTEPLEAAVIPEDADYESEDLTWSSSDTNVATVDAEGIVTAVAAGTTEITVTVNGKASAPCEVTVTATDNKNIVSIPESEILKQEEDQTVLFVGGEKYWVYPYTSEEAEEAGITDWSAVLGKIVGQEIVDLTNADQNTADTFVFSNQAVSLNSDMNQESSVYENMIFAFDENCECEYCEEQELESCKDCDECAYWFGMTYFILKFDPENSCVYDGVTPRKYCAVTGATVVNIDDEGKATVIAPASDKPVTPPTPEEPKPEEPKPEEPKPEEPVFTVGGKVLNANTTPAVSADVALYQGKEKIDFDETGASGEYSFDTVKAGTYNLVITYGGKTVTKLLEVSEKNVTVPDVILPNDNVSSELEVKGDKAVVVGGLDAEANAVMDTLKEENPSATTLAVKVEMTVEETTPAPAVQTAIESKAASKSKKLDFVDIDITKFIKVDSNPESEESITETDNYLQIVIPFVTDGKKDFKVYRYHENHVSGTDVQVLEESNDSNRERIVVDREKGTITIYAKFFSTYAIGYNEGSGNNGSGSNGGGSSRTYYTITGADTENGKVTISRKQASKGSTVTIKAVPEEGYELDELTVTDSKGNELKLTDEGNGIYTFKMPSSKVTVDAQFVKAVVEDIEDTEDVEDTEYVCPKDETCPIYDYVDASTTQWYHDGVHYCLENGLMVGVEDDLFAPNGTTTRAQLVTILWRMEGKPMTEVSEGFNDILEGEWYYDAVRWGSSNGVVTGYGDSIFGPNDVVTREQMVSILYRYAQYKGIDVRAGEDTDILSYGDASAVSAYAVPAMQWACGSDVVNGMKDADGTMILSPKGGTTRAQMATMMMRFCEDIAK